MCHKAFGLFDRDVGFHRPDRCRHETFDGEPGFGLFLQKVVDFLLDLDDGESLYTGGGGHGVPSSAKGLGDLIHVHIGMAAAPDDLDLALHGDSGDDGIGSV